MKPSIRAMLIAFMASTMLLLSVAPSADAAITCSGVIKYLQPCVQYLKSGSGKPPPACCSGASSLASAATASADKKVACGCIKQAAKGLNPKPALAQSLPKNCGIQLAFSISPNVDCSKIA